MTNSSDIYRHDVSLEGKSLVCVAYSYMYMHAGLFYELSIYIAYQSIACKWSIASWVIITSVQYNE